MTNGNGDDDLLYRMFTPATSRFPLVRTVYTPSVVRYRGIDVRLHSMMMTMVVIRNTELQLWERDDCWNFNSLFHDHSILCDHHFCAETPPRKVRFPASIFNGNFGLDY